MTSATPYLAAEAPQTYKIMVRNESGSVGSGGAETGEAGEAGAMHRCHTGDDIGEHAPRLQGIWAGELDGARGGGSRE